MDGIGKDVKFYYLIGILFDVFIGILYVVDYVRNKYVVDFISLQDVC